MRHGEVGVEFYGAPEEGNSCTIASLSPRDICRGIGLQGLQRRRRNLVKGNVESPDRIQRLTQRLPHFGSFLAQHLQYFFLGCSLDLLLREYLAGIAVHRLQSNHVLSAEAGDGARQHGLAAAANANLSRHLRREPVPWSASHQLQGLAHHLVRQEVEERRLGKLCGETLLQGVVEHRIPRHVSEVCQDDGVFFGEWARAARIKEKSDGEGNGETDRWNDELPEFSAPARSLRCALSFRNDQATFNSGVIIPVVDDGSDPPVSPPGKGLDKLWLFGAVAQCLPQPVHCLVEIVLEIDKRVGGPKSFLQLFARDYGNSE